jgi:hypothetical protein
MRVISKQTSGPVSKGLKRLACGPGMTRKPHPHSITESLRR